MSPAAGRLEAIFARVLRARWLFVSVYGLLLVPSVHFAIQVGQDNSLDRLIVPGDPDYVATQEFEKSLFLYRSLRTLLAFLVTLGACLALSRGYIGTTGGTFTPASSPGPCRRSSRRRRSRPASPR